MKRALVVTDIHKREYNVHKLISRHSPHLVLDCGDHDEGFFTDKPIPWYFIIGNHEDREVIFKMRKDENPYENLNLIQNGEIIDIDGTKILGFGGNYSPNSFENSDRSSRHWTHISREDLEKVKKRRKEGGIVHIIMMHESVQEIWENHPNFDGGAPPCSEIFRLYKPKLVVSGHYHHPMHRVVDESLLISLNTPREFNHILLELREGDVKISDYRNTYDKDYSGKSYSRPPILPIPEKFFVRDS